MQSTPDQILETEGPGADVALRYKYQHCYAAIHALKTAFAVASVEEVICENHEDFLVRFSDGTLVAVQIKTRERSQPLFKGKDAEVIKALARFAKLDFAALLAHELCHLKEHNHSPRYYRLLREIMPGWEPVKARLDGMAELLLNE